MNSRPLTALVALAPFALLASGCATNEAAPASSTARTTPIVAVVPVTPKTVALSTEWITTLDGYVNAQIRPQVSGYLVKRAYREGSLVRKGEVLFEIDSRPFAIVLAQAEAQLAEARAQLGRAERDVERNTPLAQARAIAQSQLENDVQNRLAAQAAVKAAEAAVEGARLNLSFTKVRSLVDGVAAIATAQIGDLVGPTTLLTTVSQVDPIRAYFSISEQEYLRLAEQINAARPDLWKTGGLKLTLADGSIYPAAGRFLAADREIDPKTGTIRISAAFPNKQRVLRPGQYGRVTADTRTLRDALLVPQRAIQELQGGSRVRVVADDDTVRTRTVKTGPRVGNEWVVEQGLREGERVIVDSGPIPDGTKVTTRAFVAGAQASVRGAN